MTSMPLVAIAGALLFQVDVTLRERFLREAPQGWSRLRDAEKDACGVLHVETWDVRGGERQEGTGLDRIVNFKTNKDYARVIMGFRNYSASKANPDAERAIVVGPDYEFVADRPSPSDQFSLRGVNSVKPTRDHGLVYEKTYLYRALRAPHEFWHGNLSLEKLASDPRFEIRKISEDWSPVGRVVRVAFSLDSPKLQQCWKDAWMELDPDNDWALMKAEYTSRDGNRWSIANEYRLDRQGRNILGRFKQVISDPKTGTSGHYLLTMDDLRSEPTSESEFRLSAFGLPEPGIPMGVGSSAVHLWFFAAAIILTLSATVLKVGRRSLPFLQTR